MRATKPKPTVQPIKKQRSRNERHIDPATAALIKGMLARGDMQQDIAAFFGLNSGRISEVNTHARFQFVKAAAAADLPPRGPYLAPVAIWKMTSQLKEMRRVIDEALASIGQ